MTTNNILLTIVLLLSAMSANGQSLSALPTEQVFVATERNAYMRGDTIWASGQVTSVGKESIMPFSRYVYVELIGGAADTVLMRRKVSCRKAGQFSAAFPTSAIRGKGVCYIRAYTRFMENFSPGSFALHPLLLGRELPPVADTKSADTCTVVAEGGCMLPGVPQNLTVMLTSRNGYPVQGRGISLLSSTGDTLAKATTSPSGYAMLSFIPDAEAAYRVDYGKGAVEVSPGVSGMRLCAAFSGSRLIYNIRGMEMPKDAKLYIYDRLNGLSEVDSPKSDGALTLKHRPAAASLWLADRQGRTLAECAAVPRYHSRGEIMLTSRNAIAGQPLDHTIEGLDADTILSTTVRILPESAMPDGCIEAAVNYVSDYDSPLPFPIKWAVSDEATRASDLRPWMATAHFRRFSLQQVVNADSTIYTHASEDSLTIRGMIKDIYGKPFKKSNLIAFNKATNEAYAGILYPDGGFAVRVGDFEDGTDFHLHVTDKYGESLTASAEVTEDTYPEAVVENPLSLRRLHAATLLPDSSDTPGLSVTLNEIEVKGRRRQKVIQPKKFYGARYKDREIIEKNHYLNLLHILKNMPFIHIYRTPNSCNITTTRGSSLLDSIGSSIQLLVDGDRIENSQCGIYFEMSANDIESVELLSPAEALIYGSFINGAILVKTRMLASQKKDTTPKGVVISPPGLNNASQYPPPIVPSVPGIYNVIVDVMTPTGVYTLTRPLQFE